jgi:hypothetical membrane protein
MKSRRIGRVNWIRIMAIVCIITCISDFMVLFLLGRYYRGYSQLQNTISSLGATVSPVSEAISIWWIVIGIVFIFFGVIFKMAFDRNRIEVMIASLLIIVYGLGEGIGSGLFKADLIDGKKSLSYLLHNIVGGIGIVAALLLPLMMCKVISKENNPRFYYFSWIVFIIGSITMLLFDIHFSSDTGALIASYKGLWQRLFLLNLYVYFISVSIIMYNKSTIV